jgi:hypothetical protein
MSPEPTEADGVAAYEVLSGRVVSGLAHWTGSPRSSRRSGRACGHRHVANGVVRQALVSPLLGPSDRCHSAITCADKAADECAFALLIRCRVRW